MRTRWTVLTAVLVLAAPALAQEASFSVVQENVTPRAEATAGQTAEVGLTVNLTGEGFACSAEISAPVNVTVEESLPADAPPNASVSAANVTKSFTIPADQYQTNPYTQEANATLQAQTGGGVRENFTATLTIQSIFPAQNHTECVPQQFGRAESSTAEVALSVIADNPPEPEEPEPEPDVPSNETPENDSGANTSGQNTSAEDGGLLGVPMPSLIVPLTLSAAALLVRGTRRGG